MSDSEDLLLSQIRGSGLPEPILEYRFARPRRWRADFAFIQQMLLVEVEGGTFIRGRHTRGRGFEQDCEKYNAATLMGYRVFRFTTGMVERGEALLLLEQVLKGKCMTEKDMEQIERNLNLHNPVEGEQVARLLAEVRRLRVLAGEFFEDLGYMGEYLFVKHHWDDLKEDPWLEKFNPYPNGSPYFPDSRQPIHIENRWQYPNVLSPESGKKDQG